MSVALLVGGFFYFGTVAALSSEMGQLGPPLMPLLIIYTILLVALSVVGHIVIAIMSPKEANAKPDERDRLINHKAGHFSGYFFGGGVLLSLFGYLFFYDGNLLFYSVFASLMISQIAEYIFQIYYYRTAV